MLFAWKATVLPQILPRLLIVVLISVGAVACRGQILSLKVPLNPAPFGLIGVALAIFLGFRNGASYDRFWEARKLWGTLVIECRSLARQARSLTNLQPDDPRIRSFIRGLIAVAHTLRH